VPLSNRKKEIAKKKEKLTNRGEGDVKCCTKTGLHGTNMSIISVKQKNLIVKHLHSTAATCI
jgi:hypothetical protein